MAFGGPSRSDLGSDECDIAETVDALELALSGLSRIRHRLLSVGASLASTYVEGASDALSFAVEAFLRSADGTSGCDGAWAGLRKFQFERETNGVYATLVPPVTAAPPAFAGRSLGADLVAAGDLVAMLRADDVASALMAAALSHSDWIHLASDEVFEGDPVAARAVVATVVGRTSFPSWTRRQMGGWIDRGSADALATLGWRRMTGAALPGR